MGRHRPPIPTAADSRPEPATSLRSPALPTIRLWASLGELDSHRRTPDQSQNLEQGAARHSLATPGTLARKGYSRAKLKRKANSVACVTPPAPLQVIAIPFGPGSSDFLAFSPRLQDRGNPVFPAQVTTSLTPAREVETGSARIWHGMNRRPGEAGKLTPRPAARETRRGPHGPPFECFAFIVAVGPCLSQRPADRRNLAAVCRCIRLAERRTAPTRRPGPPTRCLHARGGRPSARGARPASSSPGIASAGVRWPRPPASRFPRPARSALGHRCRPMALPASAHRLQDRAAERGPVMCYFPPVAAYCWTSPPASGSLYRRRRPPGPFRAVAGARLRRTSAGTAARPPGGGPCDRDGERR